MRLLLLNHDYPKFLDWLYGAVDDLDQRSYAEQMDVRNESLFGVADFYSRNFSALGHLAIDVHANNARLQHAWAREHGMTGVGEPAGAETANRPLGIPRAVRRVVPAWARRVARRALERVAPVRGLYYEILQAQIEDFRPDVFFIFQMESVSHHFLRRLRGRVGAIVGQRPGAPLPRHVDARAYDLVVSSFPTTIDDMRRRGVAAALQPLGFERSILDRLPALEPSIDVSFVGSLGEPHSRRVRFLEAIAGAVPQLRIWAPDVSHLPKGSTLRDLYMGQAWGRVMYDVLRSSRIVLNQHGETDLPYANNMRLFEATGVGAFVLTDEKTNLGDLFEPNREVATYRDAEHCIDRIRHFLAHPEERLAIARAGQVRTLREHTYAARARELVTLIEPFLSAPRGGG
jgi:spore maturation protein CgeB